MSLGATILPVLLVGTPRHGAGEGAASQAVCAEGTFGENVFNLSAMMLLLQTQSQLHVGLPNGNERV